MPANLIQVDANTSFPFSVYIDSNLILYATDRLSPVYPEAASIVAELIGQKTKVFLSSLVVDEVWYKLTKSTTAANRGFGLTKEDAIQTVESYLNLGFEPAGMDSKSLTDLATEIFRLTPGFKARDSFHLACAIFNKIEGFITSDNGIAKRYTMLNFPISIYKYAS